MSPLIGAIVSQGDGRFVADGDRLRVCFGRMRGMIDLGFVRANLPLVEEKLRSRGMDPAAVLGDFCRGRYGSA